MFDAEEAMGDECGTARLYSRWRAGMLGKDHRPGEASEPSRNPSSNRLGHPSSVCLESNLATIAFEILGGFFGIFKKGLKTYLLKVSRRANL